MGRWREIQPIEGSFPCAKPSCPHKTNILTHRSAPSIRAVWCLLRKDQVLQNIFLDLAQSVQSKECHCFIEAKWENYSFKSRSYSFLPAIFIFKFISSSFSFEIFWKYIQREDQKKKKSIQDNLGHLKQTTLATFQDNEEQRWLGNFQQS